VAHPRGTDSRAELHHRLIVCVGDAPRAWERRGRDLPCGAAALRRARVEARGKHAEKDAGNVGVDERGAAFIGE